MKGQSCPLQQDAWLADKCRAVDIYSCTVFDTVSCMVFDTAFCTTSSQTKWWSEVDWKPVAVLGSKACDQQCKVQLDAREEGATLRPGQFNIIINDLDDEMKCTLMQVCRHEEVGSAVDRLDGCAAIQRDPDIQVLGDKDWPRASREFLQQRWTLGCISSRLVGGILSLYSALLRCAGPPRTWWSTSSKGPQRWMCSESIWCMRRGRESWDYSARRTEGSAGSYQCVRIPAGKERR